MDDTVDLRALGTRLRERRKALDLTREDVAARAGVTPAYLYLIEHARPRSGGTPSRPKREFLRRWAEVLGMDEQAIDDVLRLAGYAPVDDAESPGMMRSMPIPNATLFDRMEMPAPMSRSAATRMSRERMAPAEEAMDLTGDTRQERDMLHAGLDAVLDRAQRSQTVWRETVRALDTLLTYLARRLDDADDGT
ncbi:MAG: hypothetical protein NVS2B16_23860 [Chloroflexota bacterium]